MKVQKFIQLLKKQGVTFTPGKGSHKKASLGDKRSVVACHLGKDLSPTYVKLVCKQLGLDPEKL